MITPELPPSAPPATETPNNLEAETPKEISDIRKNIKNGVYVIAPNNNEPIANTETPEFSAEGEDKLPDASVEVVGLEKQEHIIKKTEESRSNLLTGEVGKETIQKETVQVEVHTEDGSVEFEMPQNGVILGVRISNSGHGDDIPTELTTISNTEIGGHFTVSLANKNGEQVVATWETNGMTTALGDSIYNIRPYGIDSEGIFVEDLSGNIYYLNQNNEIPTIPSNRPVGAPFAAGEKMSLLFGKRDSGKNRIVVTFEIAY